MADRNVSLERMLAEGDTSDVFEEFKRDLQAHGFVPPSDRIQRRRLIRMWAVEHGKAMLAIAERNRGKPVETPPLVQVALSAKRMRDAYEAWKQKAVRSEKTAGVFGRHVEMFQQMMDDPPCTP